MTIESGRNLLHYRLVEKIGEGGMGVVWKAVDTNLDREVAIKILPDAFSADAERLVRFEREAKLLASLNHPGIAAVYGLHEGPATPSADSASTLEEQADVRFLAMELVAGEDLAQRLERGPIPVRETLTCGRQVAEALETAHDHGVIHRDLKPANVKLDAEGRAKVLDFGLAKALDTGPASGGDPAASPTLTSAGTLAGAILGTAAYMSPEQARGTAVDKRADVWAFGAMIFEMLAGRRPFEGDTITDTLAAVLKSEPDWSALPADTPPPLMALLRRCLDKDRKRRLRDVGEARILLGDLETGRVSSETESTTAVESVPRRGRASWLAVAAIAGALSFAAGYLLRPVENVLPRGIEPDARLRHLTFEPGLEQEPTLSPDGNYVAYTTDDRGNLDIVVLPLAGGNANRVIDDDADDAHPAWSPDGTRLAFVSARARTGRLSAVGNLGAVSPYVLGRGGDIYLVPAMGGTTVKLVEGGAYPAWSPDGDQLVFQSDRNDNWDIWVVSAEGGEPRALTEDAYQDYQPSWSPDGRFIAFASNREEFEIRLIPAAGGEPVAVLAAAPGGFVLGPVWSSDGRWIYFASSRSASASTMNLWRVAVDSASGELGEAERVTLSEASDVDPALARDDSRLAFSTVRFTPDIWELDVPTGELRQVTSAASDEDFAHLSPDGESLVVQSDRGGDTQALWTVSLDGEFLERITTGKEPAGTPRWSPDGDRIAYHTDVGDRSVIVIGAPGGVSTTEVATVAAPAALSAPVWSPDGNRLAWYLGDRARSSVWVTDIGGEPLELTPGDGLRAFPTWSPDGRQIAFHHEVGGPRQIWVVPAEGGEARPITRDDIEYSHPQWSPVDPDRILVVIEHENLGLVSVSTGEVELITEFDQSTTLVDYPSWSADGKRVYFSLYRKVGDLYLLEDY